MKKIMILAIMAIFACFFAQGQKVNTESTINVDTTGIKLSVQRIEVATDYFAVKYDHKKVGLVTSDVLGIVAPSFYNYQDAENLDRSTSIGGMFLSLSNNNIATGLRTQQYVASSWVEGINGSSKMTVEAGYVGLNRAEVPWGFVRARMIEKNVTVEAYIAFGDELRPGFDQKNQYYIWVAYHPEHLFISAAKADKQYWGLFGTKNYKDFGNCTFGTINPETGNYWFRSQFGFGNASQGFFSQDTYVLAMSYLVVPSFYYIHFSPMSTKGDITLKVDGRRTGDTQNYELITGKKIGDNVVRLSAGINSEYKNGELTLAPLFELYKNWKSSVGQCVVELRYDPLHKAGSAFLIMKF